MLHRNILVTHLFGFFICLGKGPAQILAHVLLTALDLYMTGQYLFGLINKSGRIHIHLIHQFNDQTVFFIQQRI